MARLFISNTRLEAWSAEGKLALTGDRLMLPELARAFHVRPAVYFESIAGGGDDPNELLGTVRDETALATMGADHMMTSVIYGDTAYEVVNGFLGEPEP
ncbi:MAG: hypothetical protein IPL61_07930 [Myxococcales bacterium]|nr:hypothetical protein [Myxococcales bacterium]